MLQLVSEQYDSPVEIMEYELFGPERIAQMMQEDLDRYHHSILQNSVTMEYELERSTSNLCLLADEIKSEANDDASMAQVDFNDIMLQFRDETKSEMAELKSELSDIISLLRDLNNELEATPKLLTPPPTSLIEEPLVCNDFNSRSKTTVKDDDMGIESTIEDYVTKYESRLIEIPDSNGVISYETTFNHSNDEENKQNEESDCVILGKMNDACKVFAELPEPILVEYFLDTAVTKDAHKVLDERPVLPWDGYFNGKKIPLSPYSYIIETGNAFNGISWSSGILIGLSMVSTPNLNYEDVVLRDTSSNVPPFSNLGFIPQVFDPGTLAPFKQGKYEGQLHYINSELFMTYSQVYGESRIFNHSIIDVRCILFEWVRSRNGLNDWVLRMWNSKEFLSWNCNSLLWICNIAGADSFINNSDISPLTHAIWSIRLFSDFHFGALAQMCTALDQTVSRLTNGQFHVGLLIQRLLFEFSGRSILYLAIVEQPLYTLIISKNLGYQHVVLQKFTHRNNLLSEGLKPTQAWARRNSNNGLLIVGFNFNNHTLINSGGEMKYAMSYSFSAEVVPQLFIKAHGTAFTGVVSSLRQVHSTLLSKFLYCRPLSLEGLTTLLDIVTSFGSWIGLLSPMRADFAWDPGICVIFTTSLGEILGKDGLSLRPVSFFAAYGVILVKWLKSAECSKWGQNVHSLTLDVQIQVFIGEKVMFVVKMISCLILCSDGWTYSLDLADSSGMWPCWLYPLKANFMYDPGICSIFIYILEDMDGFKRVGIWIISMDHRIESSFTMPILLICGEDHFEAITLQQAGDMAYASARSSKLENSMKDVSRSVTFVVGFLIFNVDLCIYKEMFCFHPGGCQWPQVGCQFFELNGASVNYNEFKPLWKKCMAAIMLFLDGIGIFGCILSMDFDIIVTFGLHVYIAAAGYAYYGLSNHLSFIHGFNGVYSAEVSNNRPHMKTIPREVAFIVTVTDARGHVYYALIRLFQAGNLCVQLGCYFEPTLIRFSLRSSTWMHNWKCHWDDRRAWVLSIGTEMENFVWNPGIVEIVCSYVTLPISYYAVPHYGRVAASNDRTIIDVDLSLLKMRAEFGLGITYYFLVSTRFTHEQLVICNVVLDTHSIWIASAWKTFNKSAHLTLYCFQEDSFVCLDAFLQVVFCNFEQHLN